MSAWSNSHCLYVIGFIVMEFKLEPIPNYCKFPNSHPCDDAHVFIVCETTTTIMDDE
jgi:hypothetical protein